MLLFGPKNDVISKKKGLLRNFNGFCGRNQAVHMRLRWAFHFSMSFGFMGPGIIAPPAPSLVGSGGGYSPPVGLSTKMQNKENTTFLALLRLFLRWNGLKSDASFETNIQGGGANLSKIKVTNH